jgi:glycine cleavage system aminomethyltransferase T
MSIEYPAFESDLERFIRLDEDVDACGSEAIYQDGRVVDRATSGGYSWRTQKSLAPGLVSRVA